MSYLSDFLPSVLPYVRDVSDVAAENAVRLALIEFCEKTDWLRMETDPSPFYAGQPNVEIETPLDTLPLRVLQLDIVGNQKPLEERTIEWLARLYGNWREEEGTPRFFTGIERNFVRLVPSPDEDGTISMIVSLRPTMAAREIDDTLFERFHEVISHGAQARLKNMRGEPFYDPTAAADSMRWFRQGMGHARNEVTRGFAQGIQQVQYRKFV